MTNFVHVGFTFPGVPKVRDLEPVFNAMGGDWIRYSATNWIIWTDKSVGEIFLRVKRHIDPQDLVVVVELNSEEIVGFLPPWMWVWMHSKDPGISLGPEVEAKLLDLLPLMPPSA